MKYIIEAILCILAGGYGGFRYGQSALLKAQAIAAAGKTAAQSISAAVKK